MSVDSIFLPKSAILPLLGLKSSQFDMMKRRQEMPLSVGINKNATYNLKEVIEAWVAFNVAKVERTAPADEDVRTQLDRSKLEWQNIKNAKERKDLITQDAAVSLLNHYVTTFRNALITLEFAWSPEIVGLKTEVDAMKRLAELRDRLLMSLNDPDDVNIDTLLDDFEKTTEEEDGDDE